MIYDVIEMVYCSYCIFVAYSRKCIIIPILNLISRYKVDWFKVGGFFLYLPTYWYYTEVGNYRAVSVE